MLDFLNLDSLRRLLVIGRRCLPFWLEFLGLRVGRGVSCVFSWVLSEKSNYLCLGFTECPCGIRPLLTTLGGCMICLAVGTPIWELWAGLGSVQSRGGEV